MKLRLNGNIRKKSGMRRVLFLILLSTLMSCSTARKTSSYREEDQLILTRKYIGNFIDYCYTSPTVVGGEDLIWIKTTMYNYFGKISAYSKTCVFSLGDKIYLKPTDTTPDKFGNWIYQIENDYSVSYKVSDLRFENNSFTRGRSL